MFNFQKIKKLIILIIGTLVLSSCANYMIRKECEKVNWHQHGYDIAMTGKRITGDSAISRCEKAGFDVPDGELDLGFKSGMSNYCKPDVVFDLGKQGEHFNYEFCDPARVKLIQQKHQAGLKAYCSSGYRAGASGKKYQGVCSPEQEKSGFIKDYNRGRIKYIETVVIEKQKEIQDIDSKIPKIEKEEAQLRNEASKIPTAQIIYQQVFNPATKKNEKKRLPDPFEENRKSINNRLKSLEAEKRVLSLRKSQLQKEINEFQREKILLE